MSVYLNLLAIPSTQIITEVFMDTNITIEGISWEEVGKYLAINLTKEEIRYLGLQDLQDQGRYDPELHIVQNCLVAEFLSTKIALKSA